MPVRAPLAAGVKATSIRQVARGLIGPDSGHVLLEVILKSPGFDPLIVMLLMLSTAAELELVSVELRTPLVAPTLTEPNFSEEGLSVAVGAAVPVPVKVTT